MDVLKTIYFKLTNNIFVLKVDLIFLQEGTHVQPVVFSVKNVNIVVLRGIALVLYMKVYQLSSLSRMGTLLFSKECPLHY